MRRYTILSIVKTNANGAGLQRYDAQRTGNDYTGNYICPTLNIDTKIVSDFICMPNTYINSVCDETRHLNFEIGEVTTQGRITGFVPNKATMGVLIAPARTVIVPITTLTKVRVTAPVQTAQGTRPATVVPVAAGARATTAPSRSQQPADEIAILQTQIDGVREIRLEKTMKKSIPKTLQVFLVNFFQDYNNEKNTIYTNDKTVQTTPGRRRSLGDIYKLCKYYFPDCTLRQVLVLLYTTLPTVLTNGFRSSYCSTIRKRVWYYDTGNSNTLTNTDIDDEYGHKALWYTSKL